MPADTPSAGIVTFYSCDYHPTAAFLQWFCRAPTDPLEPPPRTGNATPPIERVIVEHSSPPPSSKANTVSDTDKIKPKGVAVPASRLARLTRFGGLATTIAGGMALEGARRFAAGERPSLTDLLLTPANAIRITQQLSQLRGAAMKLGQLLSMDAGDLLPAELADILSQLRSNAHPMPRAQLEAELDRQWGANWQRRFQTFSFTPIAAASIGQVHRATTLDGRDLAIKIQYPGVRRSIDSDVDNVASLLALSGLVPKTLDLAPMLTEAKRQLHEEADYAREGDCLDRFQSLLSGDADYRVPTLHRDLTTDSTLAMSFASGIAVDRLAYGPQAERDRVATLLMRLVVREIFDFHLMQTDPNFANYHYSRDTQQLILLDFGATRAFPPSVTESYRGLMIAGLNGDAPAARQIAMSLGFFDAATPAQHQATVMEMFDIAMQAVRFDGAFDFGQTDIAARLRDAGLTIAVDRSFWHMPPMDTLFMQRKIAGVFLLASRLKARVNVRALIAPHAAANAALAQT